MLRKVTPVKEAFGQRERVLRFAEESFGTQPEYLWADTPEAAVLRHPNSKKWYGILMRVPRDRLGLEGSSCVDVLNVKCGPLLLGSLLAEPGFLPAYHMSKSHWASILLNGTVADEAVFSLLELSYAAVAPKPKQRKRRLEKEELL